MEGRRLRCTLLIAGLLFLVFGCAAARAAQTYTHPFDGYSVSYPNTWYIDGAQAPGESVEIRNFPEASRGTGGGEFPPGGAAITIKTLHPKTNEYAYLRFVYDGEQKNGLARGAQWATGRAELRFVHSDQVNGPTHVVLFAPRKGGKLFYANLTYRLSDPHGPDYERIARNIIGSIKMQPH